MNLRHQNYKNYTDSRIIFLMLNFLHYIYIYRYVIYTTCSQVHEMSQSQYI